MNLEVFGEQWWARRELLCYYLQHHQRLQSAPEAICLDSQLTYFIATDLTYSLFLSNIKNRDTVIKTLCARIFRQDAFLPKIKNAFVPVKLT